MNTVSMRFFSKKLEHPSPPWPSNKAKKELKEFVLAFLTFENSIG